MKILVAPLTLFVFASTVSLDYSHLPATPNREDTSLTQHIQDYLNQKKPATALHYPTSIKRFYNKHRYQSLWIRPNNQIRKTWEAMLMLDCVLQFGLSHDDYHPKELIYEKLHQIYDQPDRISSTEKAKFEVLLTDAMLTFINHLHYGKFNAAFTREKLDRDTTFAFKAENILTDALQAKDFMSTIGNVQPTSKQYRAMQSYMKLVKGQYLDDCYEVPEADVRKVAINMERLRWANICGDNYIQINIPSFTLTYYQADSAYLFKTVVGKPASPTPELQSVITYFKTAPDWNVPRKIFIKEILPKSLKDKNYLNNNHFSIYDLKGNYVNPDATQLLKITSNPDNYFARQSPGCDNALGLIAFRFPNPYNVYLHDTPDKTYFEKKMRALSHGCIRVEDAEKLAALLLKYDNSGDKIKDMNRAIAAYKPKQFYLNHPIPFNITYLTCEIKDGLLVKYDDVYCRDEALEKALYNLTEKPVAKKKPLTIKMPPLN